MINSARGLSPRSLATEPRVKVSVAVPDGRGEKIVTDKYVKNNSPCGELVKSAAVDLWVSRF